MPRSRAGHPLRTLVVALVAAASLPACPAPAPAPDASTLDAAPGADAAPADAARQSPAIRVENVRDGDALPHDLCLLRGAVDVATPTIRVRTGATTREFPVVAGRFKALALLREGDNPIELAAGAETRTLRLSYAPQSNARAVRLVYLLAADGDGSFDAPPGEPHDVASAIARIRVAARLMQTFVAESLLADGLGRRTFRLELGADGEPVVETLRSTLTLARARAMTGDDLYRHFYAELATRPRRDETIDVAVMSMTHYDPATRRALAHTALGGGRLGLFGSGTLHTWAPSLDDVGARFADTRRIDTATLFDDSAGRATHWANFATGLGATLHELGHALSLPHPTNGRGIMSRQFDHINRMFVMAEPASANTPAISPVLATHEVGWDRSNAVRLRYHRWLAVDERDYAVTTPPEIRVNGADLVVASRAGVRHVAYHVNGDVAAHEEFLDRAPEAFTATLASLRARFPTAARIRVASIDDDGNIGQADVALP